MTHPVFKRKDPMTQHTPNATAEVTQNSSSAERARILLSLLNKQTEDEDLGSLKTAARDMQGDTNKELPSRETLRKSARDLIARLEERKPAQARPTAPHSSFDKKRVIKSTIAALIHDSTLPREHPAVIAIVLENQPPQTQAAVIRGLPGHKARRVQRALTRLTTR